MPEFRAFDDIDTQRRQIYRMARDRLRALPPLSNATHRLELADVGYDEDDDDFMPGKDVEKRAILQGSSLHRPLKGTVRLFDGTSGQMLDEQRMTLARIPHLNSRGLFIRKGVIWSLRNQQRLSPGIYKRRRSDGGSEAHFNIRPGTGRGFRVLLEPETGIFKMQVGQSTTRLYPVLRALGIPDDAIKASWGEELYNSNFRPASAHDETDLKKLVAKLAPRSLGPVDNDLLPGVLKDVLARMQLDPDSTELTMGERIEHLAPEHLLSASTGVLRVARGEDPGDNRDSQAFQTVHGAEDFIAERLQHDQAGGLRKLLWKATRDGKLPKVPAVLDCNIDAVFQGSGLAQCYDSETSVLTRRGFIAWPSVVDDDEFACLVDGRVVYSKASRIVRERHVGSMIRCRTQVLSFLVTPNHRCLVRRRLCRFVNGRRVQEYVWSVESAASIVGRRCGFRAELGNVERSDPVDVTISAVEDRHGNTVVCHFSPGDWAEFLGWWLSEGSAFVYSKGRTPEYRVLIAQSWEANPHKQARIAELLDRMGIRYRYSRGSKQFVIRHKALCLTLMQCGSSSNRRFPRSVFEFSNASLRRLFDAYLAGDGNEYNGHLKFSTISRGMADDLVELCCRLGYVGRMSEYERNDRPNYVVSAGTTLACSAESSRRARSLDHPDPWSEEDYDGVVYCATVPGGLLYVQRDGKPHWSGNSVEDINPFEIHDARQAITRLGSGGISSEQSVSRAARGVQASYLGVIDANRGPESSRLGLDLRVTDAALKGPDNRLYTRVINPRTGESEIVSARTLSQRVVTFPGEMEREGRRVPVIRGGEMTYARKEDVDYIIPNANALMSRATAMIPFPESVKGQRLLMGSRFTQQAMPLKDAEAPLVQTADAEGRSLHELMGVSIGAQRSSVEGVVTKVTPDAIHLTTPTGERKVVSLFNNYPAARKTVVHNTPVVKKGDFVSPGQLLARSNFTDEKGVAAIGRNLRVAYMVAEGDTLEDAYKLSESAAKKLTSEAMYRHDLDLSDIQSTKKADYNAVYPSKYKKEQLDKMDDDGVIIEGAKVEPGDPLIFGIGKKSLKGVGAVMQSPRSSVTDRTLVWEHQAPGVVTDVVKTRGGIVVNVKSYDMMRAADKLANRFGGKGVVSVIVPDEQMPVDSQGRPIEVISNALGISSRVNPGTLAEALLGKVAEKTGKPFVIPGFSGKDVADFALKQALLHGVIREEDGQIVDTETLTDPRDGRKIPNVFTGVTYLMKMHHMAESKMSARDVGSYTTEGFPARGGAEGAKKIGLLDLHSLLAAGATGFLRDAKLIRGQRNDDYWRAIRSGEDPVEPTVSFADEQFRALLRGAGVNVRERGSRTQLRPLLDREVDQFAQHEIENSQTFDFETMRPIPGGLFDLGRTGGAEGNRFAKITLPKKIPHPLFMDPIQRLLGLTEKRLEAILAGSEELHGKTGPEAVEAALSGINIDREMARAKELIRTGRGAQRDLAVKRLNYLTGLKTMEIKPQELMVSKIPVIPPKYRPITQARGADLVHDLNYLYHDLLEARQNYQDASKEFGTAGDEYLTMMRAVQAITGVRDPVSQKNVDQGVKGILRYAIGIGDSPKTAMYQRKVIGTSVDTVGRGVVAADKNLDMDEIGMPEEMAWREYRQFVVRRLVRLGVPATEALTSVEKRTPMARKALEEEMKERPVVYNRAPALHRYSYVAAWPKIRKDNAIGLPYQTLKGLNADFDGDTINIHVPVSAEAIADAKEKLMPSKNLFFTGDFETHLEPMQDYLAGLFLASLPDQKRAVVTFATEDEAKKAFVQGRIDMRTPIRILKGV